MSVFEYLKWEIENMRKWAKRTYERPTPLAWLFMLVSLFLIAFDYVFYGLVSFATGIFYYMVCRYATGEWKSWCRQNYRRTFLKTNEPFVQSDKEFPEQPRQDKKLVVSEEDNVETVEKDGERQSDNNEQQG